jgi:hypothetical protein
MRRQNKIGFPHGLRGREKLPNLTGELCLLVEKSFDARLCLGELRSGPACLAGDGEITNQFSTFSF